MSSNHPIKLNEFDTAICQHWKEQEQLRGEQLINSLSQAAQRAYRILRVKGSEPRATYTQQAFNKTLSIALSGLKTDVETVYNELDSAGLLFESDNTIRVVDPGLAEGAEIFFQDEV